jgi:2-polyprenyl-3-methyl-5-hydroxy-6-metoxy-1,4-benzoquinol methylase
MIGAPDKLSYTPLERIKVKQPVTRIPYITQACQNKTVLDLGAMDETAVVPKRGSGSWLHEEIARAAACVIGIDSSEKLPEIGLVTGNNSTIRKGNVYEIEKIIDESKIIPDVLVAGELIEHLENPLHFLRSIRQIPKLKEKLLLLSTPNATAIHNCVIAMANRESTHHDHLQILSFKTLTTLLSRAGYESWQITPYHADFAEMRHRNNGVRRQVVVAGQMVVNLAERMFPMLSFGYIVETTI